MANKAYIAVGNNDNWTGITVFDGIDPEDLGINILDHIENIGIKSFSRRLHNSGSWEGFTGERDLEWGNGRISKYQSNPLSTRFLYLIDKEKEKVSVFKSLSLIIPRGTFKNNRENVIVVIDGEYVHGSYYGNMVCWFHLVKSISINDYFKRIKMQTVKEYLPEIERKYWDCRDEILVIREGAHK